MLTCLALAGLTQIVDVLGDHAFNNALTVLFVLIAGIAGFLRIAFFSDLSWRTRLSIFGTLLGMVVTFFVVFRVEGFTGEMYPRFALRFRAPPPRAVKPFEAASDSSEETGIDLATTTPFDFPNFLGPGRDQSVENVVLSRDWQTQPPKLLWKQPIGTGWSGFAIVNHYALTLEQQGTIEFATCYDVKTGELQWSHGTETRYELLVAGTGPRSTPTIDEGRVYTFGATGWLSCLDGATGRALWKHNLREMYDISDAEEHAAIQFGRSNSPLVINDLVVIPVGGPLGKKRAGLVAFHKHTGERVWEGDDRNASYSSPVPATIGGVPEILIVNEDSVSGHDPQTGRTLWEFPWLGTTSGDANVSQAVPVGNDRVFLSKGYVRGAALLKIDSGPDGTQTARDLWKNPQVLKTKFTNVVLYSGYVYGLSDGILECVDLESGKRAWKDGRYGHGQILLVGDLLLVLSETGELVLIQPDPREKNHVLSRMQVLEGKTWNPLALSGKYLLVRNAEQAACYEMPLDR